MWISLLFDKQTVPTGVSSILIWRIRKKNICRNKNVICSNKKRLEKNTNVNIFFVWWSIQILKTLQLCYFIWMYICTCLMNHRTADRVQETAIFHLQHWTKKFTKCVSNDDETRTIHLVWLHRAHAKITFYIISVLSSLQNTFILQASRSHFVSFSYEIVSTETTLLFVLVHVTKHHTSHLFSFTTSLK